jgi:hypothetical protein
MVLQANRLPGQDGMDGDETRPVNVENKVGAPGVADDFILRGCNVHTFRMQLLEVRLETNPKVTL